ncbi:MAG: hypothetical protein AB7O55_28670, partial [Lautropia sp.]
ALAGAHPPDELRRIAATLDLRGLRGAPAALLGVVGVRWRRRAGRPTSWCSMERTTPAGCSRGC